MNIRFYHARILSMETDMEVRDGELMVQGTRILYVGASNTPKALKLQREIAESGGWDREIDAEGNLLLPGFKDAHTHSGMTFLRSYADDLPLSKWLNDRVFPMEAKLTADDIYHLTKLAILEYLSSGITANFDMYLTPDTIAQAALDCGFRTVMTGGFNDFSQSLEELERWYLTYNEPDSLVSFQLGFHAEYTTSYEHMEGVAALAKKYRAPVYAHNSETRKEVEECLGRYQMTPTALMEQLGIFDYGGGGYHCVWMSEEDLDIFRQRGLWAVTNPGSNTKLASGIAPIREMLKRGVRLAIGTDGPASNNCLDMFKEMFLVTGLAKLREEDAACVGAEEVLRMALSGGAGCMLLPDCDCLAPGKYADLVMIDLHQPNMQPFHSLVKNLVYSGSKSNVKLTMVGGQILYEDGVYHIGTDPEEIYARANEIVERMRE